MYSETTWQNWSSEYPCLEDTLPANINTNFHTTGLAQAAITDTTADATYNSAFLSSFQTWSDEEYCGYWPPESSATQTTYHIAASQITVSSPETEIGFASPSSNDPEERARKERRRAQNRASQRAYRQRKDARIEEGMTTIKEITDQLRAAQSANDCLRMELEILRVELVQSRKENSSGSEHRQNDWLMDCDPAYGDIGDKNGRVTSTPAEAPSRRRHEPGLRRDYQVKSQA